MRLVGIFLVVGELPVTVGTSHDGVAVDDVILLAMTGLDPKDIRVADTFAIVDHYFQKPFELEALLRVLKPTWA